MMLFFYICPYVAVYNLYRLTFVLSEYKILWTTFQSTNLFNAEISLLIHEPSIAQANFHSFNAFR